MPARKSTKKKSGATPRSSTGKRKSSSRVSVAKQKVNTGKVAVINKSEHQLKIVLDAAKVAIWEWDLFSDAISWYGNVLEIYQLKDPTVLNTFHAYKSIIHPDDLPALMNAVENMLKGKPFVTEYRIVQDPGDVRWISASGNLLKDKKTKLEKATGTVQDITAKKQVEKEKEDWKTRHEMVAMSAGLVIYDYDIRSGNILWSGNSLEVLGYLSTELGNIDQWVELIHPEDRNDAFTLLEAAQVSLEPYDVYYRFRTKSGEYVYMHDRGFFLPGDDGKAVRMLGMMNDVTDRIEGQQRLKDSEQRFRTLQEASFGGIGLHDQGVIIDCNQGLCDISGYSYDELVGSNGLNLIAPEFRDFVFEKIKSGYDKTYDVEGIRKDGTRYVLEIRGKNTPWNGRVARVTEFRDVTDRKRDEEKIREQAMRMTALTEDLKRKNNQLEEFTQIVSHNLRSPVGNILTLLSFYEGAESEAEKAEYIGLLKEAASTTLVMLNELNEILKVKQSHNIEKQELYFEKVFEQVKSMMTARITESNALIISDFSGAPSIQYPSIYMESILLNLVDNALKYSSTERRPKIEVRTNTTPEGCITLEVKDNGIGINLQRYGHQVFKLRKTFHHHPESRGIGLFMIKNQVEAMGGEITISSKENEGTSFFINFNKYLSDAQ